ncbi:hypothetical protein E2C01_023407 [Portunus trituberculatus]|uniref:Uncharacterized protein n=1 Tax=Portunus trituberculatus TaxID=210409 RepID=A0A5B7E8Q8_PORTR|nr:hypothetical protein [Portunus trituberculatus]
MLSERGSVEDVTRGPGASASPSGPQSDKGSRRTKIACHLPCDPKNIYIAPREAGQELGGVKRQTPLARTNKWTKNVTPKQRLPLGHGL